MNELTETYLEDIIFEAYGRPIFGWSSNYFEKTIVKLLKKQIKRNGAIDFNDFFVSKKIFDFEDLFNETPEVQTSGAGESLFVKLIYSITLKEPEVKKLLLGIKNNKGKYVDCGLLFNKKFRSYFNIATIDDEMAEDDNTIKSSDNELDEGDDSEKNINVDDEMAESFENVYLKNIINEGLFKKSKKQFVQPFDMDDKNLKNLIGRDLNLSVIFEFDSVQYCKNFKKKERFNLNRLSGMTGTAYMQFNENESEKITGDGNVEWLQKRTANMDPPKPIKDEIKERWANPNQGYGLLGLATKKLVGGTFHLMGGTSINFDVVQEGSFKISFDNEFSHKCMDGQSELANKENKSEDETEANIRFIRQSLSSSSGRTVRWNVKHVNNNTYECLATTPWEETILKINFKLK